MLYLYGKSQQCTQCFQHIIKRLMSSQEAAIALRPFYFAVHPDRFNSNPVAREQNEKSLQTFNGYLNELFPARLVPPQPVQLLFYIHDNQKRGVRKIRFGLSGSDVRSVVRTALEVCGLPSSKLVPPAATQADNVGNPDVTSYREEILRKYREKWSKYSENDNLEAGLRKYKKFATEAIKRDRVMTYHVEIEIDEFKKRTGVTEVIWTMHWSIVHIRRCLIALRRLIDHAEESRCGANYMIQALRDYSLRFGIGSFVCCDGGMHFGVDSVPEEWERICHEATARRAQLPLLQICRKQLSDVFGRAEIVTPKYHSLAKTVSQLQTLISTIMSRERNHQMRLKCLGLETIIEVVTVYNELACTKDGRLLIPCNVDIVRLIDFLTKNASRSQFINSSARQLQSELQTLRRVCMKELELDDITWQGGIGMDELKQSVLRLQQCSEATRELLKGMSLHFSTNPTIYVMTDGKISLPVSWT